jgi:dihydrofolate reductase
VSGATLAASFIKLGLVDDFPLFIQPVLLGAGTPFFPDLESSRNLRLVETRAFKAGVVYVRYEVTA